jgi:hypothetical protein
LAARKSSKTTSRRRREPDWASLSDEALLDRHLSKLGLRVEGSLIEYGLEQLDASLERAGLRFRPHVWLSTDWFSPDGVPGFAVPFYLAHPRLMVLERRQMFEVQGGNRTSCLKLMRHETAHALDSAYRLHRRKRWREHFGPASRPYRASYVPNPGSRAFVQHLDYYYAQSHPIEDFAETFSVWLSQPGRWRREYEGWPALKKLEYVDELMGETRDEPPAVRTRERMDPIGSVNMTLREYYRRKKAHYGEEDLSIYDRDLQRLFTSGGQRKRASTFLREHRTSLRRQVARWTGQRAFAVDEVLGGMILRCRTLRLRLALPERQSAEAAAILVTMHTARIQRMRHREYFR